MSDDNLKAVYQELCTSYRAIDDFRMKLLAFLPFATGGIFVLVDAERIEIVKQHTFFLGLFGFVFTLGLFSLELFGIRKCGALIDAGKQMEREKLVISGQFTSRPRDICGLVNEPFAAAVIYPAVLAAWIYLAIGTWSVPIAIFVVGFFGTVLFDAWLKRYLRL